MVELRGTRSMFFQVRIAVTLRSRVASHAVTTYAELCGRFFDSTKLYLIPAPHRGVRGVQSSYSGTDREPREAAIYIWVVAKRTKRCTRFDYRSIYLLLRQSFERGSWTSARGNVVLEDASDP